METKHFLYSECAPKLWICHPTYIRCSPSQGSKFIFGFASTCATRCKLLGALPKF